MIKLISAAVVVVLVTFVVGLIVLYFQVPRYRAYWLKRAEQPVSDDAILYVALGDSTAQGIGATSPAKGYVGLVASALEDTYKKPVHVVNLSKSGATLADFINEQLPKLKTMTPTVLTVEIGANDMIKFEPNRFRYEMQQIMSRLPKNAVLSDMPYFGGGRHASLEKHALEANEIMKELSSRYGFQLAPLHEATLKDDTVMTFAIDIFHPNNRGYRNWFNAFWTVLSEKDLNL